MTPHAFTPAASALIRRAAEAARDRGSGTVDLRDLNDAVAGTDDRFRVLLAFSQSHGTSAFMPVEIEPSIGAGNLQFSGSVKERLLAAFDIARLDGDRRIDVKHLAFAAAGWNAVASSLGLTSAAS